MKITKRLVSVVRAICLIAGMLAASAVVSLANETSGNYVRVNQAGGANNTIRFLLEENGLPEDAKTFVISMKADQALSVPLRFRDAANAAYTATTSEQVVNVDTAWTTVQVDLDTLGQPKTNVKSLLILDNKPGVNVYFDDIGYVKEDGTTTTLFSFDALEPALYADNFNNMNGLKAIGCIDPQTTGGSYGWAGDIEIVKAIDPSSAVNAVKADGTIEVLEITEGQVTLPAADQSTGKVSLGWWVDGELYQNGATVAATTESTIESAVVEFTQTNGGSVRIKDPTGLRFQTKVNKADYEKIAEVVTEQGGVLALTSVVGGSAVTVENGLKVVDAGNAFHVDSTTDEGVYYSSIVGIPEAEYGTNISARGYMTIQYADGSSATVYTELTAVRNIRSVAKSAQADTEYYNTLTPEQKAIIDGFAAASGTEDPMPTGNYVRVKHQPANQEQETIRFALNGAIPADAEKFVVWMKADQALTSDVVQIKLRQTANAAFTDGDSTHPIEVGTEWTKLEIDLTALEDKTIFQSMMFVITGAAGINIYFDDISYIMADGSTQAIHDFNALEAICYTPENGYEYGSGGYNFYGVQKIGCVNVGTIEQNAGWGWTGEIEVMAG